LEPQDPTSPPDDLFYEITTDSPFHIRNPLIPFHLVIWRHVSPRERPVQAQSAQPRQAPYLGLQADKYQFTAKQLNRQAAKAGKDETTEKAKLKKVRRILIYSQSGVLIV
jgi:hypothetical protein